MKKFHINSFIFKIIATVVAGSIVLAVSLSLVNLWLSRRVFINTFAEAQGKIFNQIDNEFYHFMGGITEIMEGIGGTNQYLSFEGDDTADMVGFITVKEEEIRKMYSYFTSQTSDIVLLNQDNEVVSSNNSEYLLPDSEASTALYRQLRVMAAKHGYQEETKGRYGKRYFIQRLQSTNYKIFGIISPKAAFKEQYNIAFMIVLTVLITGMVALLIIIFMNQQTRPIAGIVRVMKHSGQKQFRQKVEVKGTDEVRALAETYNQMVEELDLYIRQLIQAEDDKRTAEIHALQMQINPHYMYNTLAGIKWLIRQGDADKSIQVIDAFIAMLRNVISNRDKLITVGQEVENLKNYVFVNQARYGESVTVEYYILPQCLNCQIPKMILQPLVENAFFHAFPDGRRGSISIFVKEEKGDLKFDIVDNGVGMTAEQLTELRQKEQFKGEHFTGIGIQNVDERIKLLYGPEYGIKIDILHFPGRYGLERVMERLRIRPGRLNYGSIRGASSHQENPFYIIADRETSEDYGNCYGLMLLYSGSFKCETEQDSLAQVRVTLGLQDEMFEYVLKPGESFYTPEAAMTFSPGGFSSLSHLNHEMIRSHVCRGPFKAAPRPILINNWEATYFDFDGDTIRAIARQAAELGVEMLVLDDGWYGERNSDNKSLGDWQVNEKKLGGSLHELVQDINGMGLKFGLWIEPEMISEDSELYRAHPDWVLAIPGRKPIRSRAQLVLDFSREEVVDYILEQIVTILGQANIEYLKMDMNRSLCDIYSRTGGEQNAGVIMHQYVLGVYRFLEQLLKYRPNLLIEGCSGGGGRFDAGMLYYTPQIWCSDNTDAIERIVIQHGTSFGYPVSAVGSHVSAVPNHQTGRTVSLKTRGVVAMAGSFGYELDLRILSAAEKAEVRQQIKDYKACWKLIHNGRYYRLHTPGQDLDYAAWLFVDKNKEEALLNIVSLAAHCNAPVTYIKCKGLDEKGCYEIAGQPGRYWGSALMRAGLPVPLQPGEYNSWQFHIRKIT